jgi:nuclear pore complex protein Nup107
MSTPGTGQTSLDPDFTLRDPQGPGLAGEDATYQGPLLETLWDLVRHGELDAAIRVCMGGLSELHQIAYRLAASCMFLRPDC